MNYSKETSKIEAIVRKRVEEISKHDEEELITLDQATFRKIIYETLWVHNNQELYIEEEK